MTFSRMMASVVDMPDVDHAGTGSARRRRERRHRAYLRYARMSVAMALAEANHHTAPRGQKTARAEEEEEVHEVYEVLREQKRPPPGERPAPLFEVAGPLGRLDVPACPSGGVPSLVSFIFFVFVLCLKSDFFRASISLRFLLTVLMWKINFWAHLGWYPFGPSFPFFPTFFFLPFFFVFFLAFYFLFFSHFLFISSFFDFLMFSIFFFHFFRRKSFFFSIFLYFFQKCFIAGVSIRG